MKMFNKVLGKAPLFQDTILALKNLTKTANELVKGYSQLAKMVIEDRQAINDLYQLYSELLLEKGTRPVTATVTPLDKKPLPVDDEKKKTLN